MMAKPALAIPFFEDLAVFEAARTAVGDAVVVPAETEQRVIVQHGLCRLSTGRRSSAYFSLLSFTSLRRELMESMANSSTMTAPSAPSIEIKVVRRPGPRIQSHDKDEARAKGARPRAAR